MRWPLRPRSLAGKLTWIIFTGVTFSLLSSAAIHLHDRDSALYNMGGIQTAQRIAAIVHALDPQPLEERKKIAAILDTPTQFVRLLNHEPVRTSEATINERIFVVERILRRFLGDDRLLHVEVVNDGEDPPPETPTALPPRTGMPTMGGMPVHHGRHRASMNRTLSGGLSFIARVQLQGGDWAEFHNHIPGAAFAWPWHLLASIVILLVVVFSLSYLAVRLVTRPMATLAAAARSIGTDAHGPPMAETGSLEVVEVIRAFNAMQARLIQYVQERSQLLAAISHDLRTPLTRMRLRIEMIRDEGLKDALMPNLDEMEQMTEAALDYIQGTVGMEETRKTDMPSLLEDLQETFQEMGHEVAVHCGDMGPFPLMRRSFKRCLANLIGNAVKYGERARVKATLHGERLRISIADDGPGIPEQEMQKVLEPFVRLDVSRNTRTGGSGLGLSIARNIILAHRGELTLRNRPEGGLEVIISIPKGTVSKHHET